MLKSDAETELNCVFVSPLSGFGQFLRSPSTFPEHQPVDVATTAQMIAALFEGLRQANILRECFAQGQCAPVSGFRINSGALIWRAGDTSQSVSFCDMLNVSESVEI